MTSITSAPANTTVAITSIHHQRVRISCVCGLRGETIDWRPQPETNARSAEAARHRTMYPITRRLVKNPRARSGKRWVFAQEPSFCRPAANVNA
jgi:hypothetical protein